MHGSVTARSTQVPRHVAVIMDGNGRFAKSLGQPRLAGHRAGARSVRVLVEECRRLGVRYLTLFSFSTENWGRSAQEVAGLMRLFQEHLEAELKNPELLLNGVRLRAIGEIDKLPFAVRTVLNQVIERTKGNTELDLILALSYGGREEIVRASQDLAHRAVQGKIRPEDITEEMFRGSLFTKDIPDPDLLIRTGGEMRISNFLLWQMAYTELMILEEFWPDFTAETFHRCLEEFANRERRFGLTSEQLASVAADTTAPSGK